jgi:hypothetical protein
VSVDQFIATAVAEKVSALDTATYFRTRAAQADHPRFDQILARLGSLPPREGDEVEPKNRPDLTASVRGSGRELTVALTDGRTLSVPLWWYPRLLRATPAQREPFEIGRFGVHWPEIDEDIELAGLLLGAKAPGATPPENEC